MHVFVDRDIIVYNCKHWYVYWLHCYYKRYINYTPYKQLNESATDCVVVNAIESDCGVIINSESLCNCYRWLFVCTLVDGTRFTWSLMIRDWDIHIEVPQAFNI